MIVRTSEDHTIKDQLQEENLKARDTSPQFMLRRSREIPGTILMSIQSFKDLSRGLYIPKKPEVPTTILPSFNMQKKSEDASKGTYNSPVCLLL
jgi:hypothetical protein